MTRVRLIAKHTGGRWQRESIVVIYVQVGAVGKEKSAMLYLFSLYSYGQEYKITFSFFW